jgi:hypothetical protein
MENTPMKKCPKCQVEIDGQAKKCPHCHSDIRPWIERHPIWTTILVLLVLGIIINASSHTNRGTTITPPATASTATWHTVTTTTISADTKTPSFAMQGTQWRISYSCTSDDPDSGFYGTISSTDNANSQDFADDTHCPGNNVSYEYSQAPGNYYLDLQVISNPKPGSATVKVEDYY